MEKSRQLQNSQQSRLKQQQQKRTKQFKNARFGDANAEGTPERRSLKKSSPTQKTPRVFDESGNDITYVVLNSDKTASIVQAVAIQKEKVDAMGRRLEYLIQSVDNIASALYSSIDPNQNNNSNMTLFDADTASNKVNNKSQKVRFAKPRFKKSQKKTKPVEINSSGLFYVNENSRQYVSHVCKKATEQKEEPLEVVNLDS